MGSLHFFLGIEVVPYQDGIYLSQVKYAKDILKRTMMHRARAIHMPLSQKGDFHITIGSPVDASDYRSIVGGLPYLTLTRPNLTYAINQVCQFMQAPTTTHWQRVKRILRFLAGIIYFDFASLLDPPYRLLASQMSIGLVVLSLVDQLQDFVCSLELTVFPGHLKKQHTVSKSSAEAEYCALASLAAEITLIIC